MALTIFRTDTVLGCLRLKPSLQHVCLDAPFDFRE